MTTVVKSYVVDIYAPLEQVFSYVSDLTKHSEWSGGRLKVEALTPGPVAVGSKYRSVGDLPNQKGRVNELRVVQLRPPDRFVFVAQDPTFGEVSHEFSFTPGDKGTRVERAVVTNMSPLMAFVSRFMIEPLVAKPMMDRAMANLKKEMERRVTS